MWLYFDQNGALLKNLEHGSPARAGTDDFEIFAVFEGMENSLTYPEAIISFKKPDSAGSVYYEFPMEPQKTFKFVRDSNFTGEETDESVYPFRNDVYYTGFYFSFHDFLGRMRNNILLDTAGTWQATIGLVSSDDEDNVVGMATFYVQPGVIDEEGQFVELDEYIQDFLSLLITKMNRKGSDVIRFVRDLSSIEEFDDNNYKIGDIIFDKETQNFYEITTLNPAHANLIFLEGYQPLIDAGHMLSADLVSDTTTEHKFVTETQRNDIDLNTAARHTHSNKAVLDTLEDTQAILDQKINAKVDKTTYPLKIYGTDEFGTQVVYDKSDFYGLVQDVKVDGVSVMNGVVAEIDLTGKADKVSGAVANNLAGLDATGNLKDSGIAEDEVLTKSGNQTVTGSKIFTGIVGNVQGSPGVYLGLDTNPGAPNANISIVSNNTAAYIDFGVPNIDFGFRIIKWADDFEPYYGAAQLVYGGNDSFALSIPKKNGTLATIEDIEALDATDITGFGANKTLSALSEVDGIISAEFQDIKINADKVVIRPASQSEAELLLSGIVPAQVSTSNELADKNFVNSSIATNTSTFRGTYSITDLGLTVTATHEQVATAIATKLASLSIIPTTNDYVFVYFSDDPSVAGEDTRYDRYKYNGTEWEYEYTLNHSSFTAAQWAAINSGATAEIISNAALVNVDNQFTTTQTIAGSDDTPLNLKANHATWSNIALFNSSNTRLGNIGANGYSPYWWGGQGNSGQIALISDIPTNFVTTDTTQTISGAKTFTADVTTVQKLVVHDEGIEIFDDTTPYIDFHYQNNEVDYTARIIETPQGVLDFQGSYPYITVNGNQVALKSDLNDYVDLTSAQTITGEKTILDTYIDFKKTNLNNYWSISLEQYENLDFTRNHNSIFKMGAQAFFATSNNARDLGTSDLKWKDLYLSGTANVPKIAPSNGDNRTISFTSSQGAWTFNSGIIPAVDNLRNIGSSSYRWKDAYLSGQIYATNTNNIIEATDITANQGVYYLNETDLAKFANGKPTRINGFVLSYFNYFFTQCTLVGSYYYATGIAYDQNTDMKAVCWQINSTTGQIIVITNNKFITNVLKTEKVDFGNNATITKDSSNRINLNYDNDAKIKVGSAATVFKGSIVPDANNSYNLGQASLSWNDLQMTGLIKNGNVTYGIGLPVMTNWTADKEVATTDLIFYKPFTPPSTLTLTDDEYNTIINGCILDSDWVVNGTTKFKKGCIFSPAWPYNNSMRGMYAEGSKISTYLIDTSTQTITNSGANDINIRGVATFDGQTVNASYGNFTYLNQRTIITNNFVANNGSQDLGEAKQGDIVRSFRDLHLNRNLVDDAGNSISIAEIASKTYADTAASTAISALDVPSTGDGAITGFGPNNTLATLTESDGIVSATFQSIQISESQVTNLTTDLGNKLDKKPDGTHDLISNNKISTTYIPDSILGQLVYGGTVTGAGVATLSTNAQSRLGTASTSITLTDDTTAITGYAANEGIFYVVSSNGSFASLGLKTGDWLISTGAAWQKVDNTDEVTSIQISGTTGEIVSSTDTSQTGNVSTTISLANNYGDNKNPYASKTANTVLASPDNSNGVPTFRALTERDIPTLSGSKIAVANATDGHLAGLNSAGNVTDSGVAANNVVTLDGTQTITGLKTIQNSLKVTTNSDYPTWSISGYGNNGLDFNISTADSNGIKISPTYLRSKNTVSDLGTSDYKWKDLYLGGTAYTNSINNGQQIKLTYSGASYIIQKWGNDNLVISNSATGKGIRISGTGNSLMPCTDSNYNLGDTTSKWQHLYLSGSINPNTNSFGLTLPDTTSFTANRTIATTNDLPQIKRYI